LDGAFFCSVNIHEPPRSECLLNHGIDAYVIFLLEDGLGDESGAEILKSLNGLLVPFVN
jgi:hypothetical protein